ncbi:MAG: RNA polymerase sigma factor [Microthrixaceae bacterium]
MVRLSPAGLRNRKTREESGRLAARLIPSNQCKRTDLFSRSPRRRPAAEASKPTLDRSLSQLIDDHSAVVFHVAYGILHDRGLAEDVVQETMIKAWEASTSFRGESSTRTWITRIAHNTAIDALRRRRDQITSGGELPESGSLAPGDDTEDRAEGRADLERLAAALRDLDELSRTIVILREVDAMSYQQIAETLELPVPTVKTRLLRARRTLQSSVRETFDRDRYDSDRPNSDRSDSKASVRDATARETSVRETSVQAKEPR